MAKNKTKAALKKEFKDGLLAASDFGAFYELVVEYRGYYISGGRTRWAGPWRNDNMAAAMDTYPYAQQGYPTGIRMKQS